MDGPSAIVVGAGVFGVAAADALAARGFGVTLVEQYAPANARGSSGDRTRLLRNGHGDGTEEQDLWHVRSAREGTARWLQLAAEEGVELTRRTGLAWFAHERDGVEARVAQRLATAGVDAQLLEPPELHALFPDLAVDDLACGLFEPDAHVIRADLAVATLLRRAQRRGARVVLEHARPGRDGEVLLGDGRTLHGDVVVWACGAWLGGLLGPDVAPVRPAWQDVVHWHAPPRWRDGPAWFDDDAGLYGFPDVDGLGIKAVSHHPGRPFDPDADDRTPDAGTVEALRAHVGRRFPALAGAGMLWARVMPYEMTPDGLFLAGPVPGSDRGWVLGGGSGHGFKHAVALGEHLADRIEGRAEQVPMLAAGPRAGPFS